jgi:hypothetical protein
VPFVAWQAELAKVVAETKTTSTAKPYPCVDELRWRGHYFGDDQGNFPPDNPDTLNKLQLRKLIPRCLPSKKWSDKERLVCFQ